MKRRGRFFEDYAVGELIQHWPGRGVLYVETRCWIRRDETVLALRRRILMAKRGA